jgi:N-acetylglucosamine-6-phosphate deacetylase
VNRRFAIINARLLMLPQAEDEGGVLITDGRIEAELSASQAPPEDADVIDARGQYLGPGLFDIHVHGGGGYSLMSDDPEEIRAYARWLAPHGVTSFLISTSGKDHAEIVGRLSALRGVVGPVEGGATVRGFHLEGPYINPVRKGAFPPRWLRAPSVDEYRELYAASGAAIVQMTLAPELPGADELIDAVVASGAVAAMGHTDATYEQAMHAIELGVSHVTHCFNAMRPFGHRDPGVLGAVMTSDAVTAELIGDGAHVDYPAARVLRRAKGWFGVALITDGMPLAGTEDGDGNWEGQPIRVEGGKAVRVADNTIIGGVIALDQTVRNAVEHLDVTPLQAWSMASWVPSVAMRRTHEIDGISPGRKADLVLLDDELRVTDVWVNGERIEPTPSR